MAAGLCLAATVGVVAFVRESVRHETAQFGRRPGPLASLHEAWSDAVLRRLIGMTFMGFASFSAMWAIFGLWGEARFGWGPKEIGLVMGVTGVAAALSQSFLSAALVRRIGSVSTIVAGLLVTSVFLLVQAASPWVWLCVVAMTLAVTGHTMTQPATSTLISQAATPGPPGRDPRRQQRRGVGGAGGGAGDRRRAVLQHDVLGADRLLGARHAARRLARLARGAADQAEGPGLGPAPASAAGTIPSASRRCRAPMWSPSRGA
ncbi:MFS transporter [Phenylobacterium sp. J367]|uniref:MFS transporter n=1 Tax=Phenylobacterium sp. J367 TaxID=2898435 RepID=UPI0021510F97|nr:MFS transporter [Phenylobacterium sp. J367]MCR5881016.1 MFS transporter [Phenylobacterium sp. J367]